MFGIKKWNRDFNGMVFLLALLDNTFAYQYANDENFYSNFTRRTIAAVHTLCRILSRTLEVGYRDELMRELYRCRNVYIK
jgi:hypothetical protein